MDMSPQEYQAYVKGMQKKSPLLKDMALAFGIGGAICVVGQLILNGWTAAGLEEKTAGTATSCTLVFLSALLTGLLFRGLGQGRREIPPPVSFQSPSLSEAIVSAVKDAAGGMLSVCAFVTLFYVLVSPLSRSGTAMAGLAVGITELFSLTPLLTCDRPGFLLAAGCAGWGGLSVLCQTAAVLDGTDLSLRPCFLGKLVQGLLSVLLAAVVSIRLF